MCVSRAVLACGVVRVCKSVRGKCRSALACARLGSLDSRAPLARRLCNLTRHARSAVLLSPRTRMLAHPSGSASPNLPSASLRRISRQSEDCHRVRVLRNPALLAQRALLTAAAFPAQHIRSALSFERRCGGAPPATARASAVRRAIQPRLRSEALGRNTSRRAAQAQSRRLARPAVCACSASCRRLHASLRAR